MGTVTERQVAHIWKRLGFGATGKDIDNGVAVGPAALINDLLTRPLTTPSQWNLPTASDWQSEIKYLGRQLQLMGSSSNPLQERMAWVLQGLVVIGIADVVYFQDLQGHVSRLRGNPFGPFTTLLSDVTVMPGMMKYLNGYQNAAQHPNQNYARELMELFALGITHPTTGAQNYTQTDVVEVARALTGYTYDWNTGKIVFDRSQFDAGNKTFLGAARGDAGVPEVIAAVSKHPAYGYYVPRRLYRELVGLEPDKATLDHLATTFGTTGDVKGVVKAIATSPAFLSAAAIGAKVKTPVELIVSGAKALGFDLSTADYGWQMRDFLNQHPFFPPNVSGWPAGHVWLNAGVTMTWCSIAQDFAVASSKASGGVAAKLLATASPSTAPTVAARLCGITDLSPASASGLATYARGAKWDINRAAGTLALVLVTPEFAVN